MPLWRSCPINQQTSCVLFVGRRWHPLKFLCLLSSLLSFSLMFLLLLAARFYPQFVFSGSSGFAAAGAHSLAHFVIFFLRFYITRSAFCVSPFQTDTLMLIWSSSLRVSEFRADGMKTYCLFKKNCKCEGFWVTGICDYWGLGHCLNYCIVGLCIGLSGLLQDWLSGWSIYPFIYLFSQLKSRLQKCGNISQGTVCYSLSTITTR